MGWEETSKLGIALWVQYAYSRISNATDSSGVSLKEITFYLEAGASAEADWRQQANCRNVKDPDLFFPVGTTGPALDQIQLAKAVCRNCPVRTQCLEWAMDTHQDCGVWGGLSEDERKALAKRRRAESIIVPYPVGGSEVRV